jgi:hypothetical protein
MKCSHRKAAAKTPAGKDVAMARAMAKSEFRSQQEQRRRDPDIAPINEFVDRLRDRDGRGWLRS